MLNITVPAALVHACCLPGQWIILLDILKRAFQNIHTQLASECGPHKGGKTFICNFDTDKEKHILMERQTRRRKSKHLSIHLASWLQRSLSVCLRFLSRVWNLITGWHSFPRRREGERRYCRLTGPVWMPSNQYFLFSLFMGHSLHRCSVKYCC